MISLWNFKISVLMPELLFIVSYSCYSALSWELSLRFKVSTLEQHKKIWRRNKNKLHQGSKLHQRTFQNIIFLPLQKFKSSTHVIVLSFPWGSDLIALMWLYFFRKKVMSKCTYVLVYLKFLFCFGKVKSETRMTDNVILRIIFP